MIVISSAELRNNLKKYLDLANTEKIVIQRGKTETFVLSAHQHISKVDLDRAITKDELLDAIESYIQALEKANIVVKVRRSRGKDIDAACGQLANKSIVI